MSGFGLTYGVNEVAVNKNLNEKKKSTICHIKKIPKGNI